MSGKRRQFVARSCTKKVRYKDHDQAVRSSQTYVARRGVPLRAYECELCNGWHLTQQHTKEKP